VSDCIIKYSMVACQESGVREVLWRLRCTCGFEYLKVQIVIDPVQFIEVYLIEGILSKVTQIVIIHQGGKHCIICFVYRSVDG